MGKWLDKFDILDQRDENDLERHAALCQHHYGMSKENSERFAYQTYKENQHRKAAAFHLDGIESAKQDGRKSDMNKHYCIYLLHSNELGKKPTDAVDPTIKSYRHLHPKTKTFEHHPADHYLVKKFEG